MGSELGADIMSGIVLTPLLALVAGSASPEGLPSFEETDHAFHAYMADLVELAHRWQRAAELIDMGDAAGAQALLSTPLPEALDDAWVNQQVKLRKRAQMHLFYKSEGIRQRNCHALGRWYLDAGKPTLAVARLQDCTPPMTVWERQEFDRCHTRALFELGRFADAADRLATLDTTGWSPRSLEEHAEWIATLRRYANDEPGASGPPCEHLKLSASSHRANGALSTIIGAYRCMQEGDAVAMRDILLDQFRRALDETARRLLLQLSATAPTSSPETAAATLLTLGVDAHSAEDFQAALQSWQRVVDQYPQTRSWPKALFNIATTLKNQHRYDEAIETFTRLRDAEVNDREPGAHLMEAYRNYRPKASWEIGLCRLASGDPEGALSDFLNTRDNFPFQSWCGNARQEYAYKYAAYEGICLEMLGAYDRAIGAYFRTFTEIPGGGIFVNRRIVNLYESAAQTDRLLRLCDEVDAYHLRELRRRHPEFLAEITAERVPTAGIRLMLKIRGMSPVEQAAELIEMIDTNHGFGPDSPGDLLSRWQAVEAARTLSQKPNWSFELVKKHAFAKHPKQRGWLCFAMSLVDPARAVPFVENELSKATNIHHCATLAFTLQQCGALGIAALERIEKRAEHPHHESVQATLALRRRWEPDPWPNLPTAPLGTLLPVRLAEIDEKVRRLESLPGSVVVGRSTPSETLASWVMALRIGDHDAYNLLTGDDRRLRSIFDDVREPSDQYDVRLLTYDLTEVTFTDKEQAAVQVMLHLGKTSHHLVFTLSRADGGWRVEGVEESGK